MITLHIDINECASNPCNQFCEDNIGNYTCFCGKGYTLVNKTECEDVDECLSNACGANSNCENTPGSFNCTCENGYESVDGRDCTGKCLIKVPTLN